jgi:hypothetical protein
MEMINEHLDKQIDGFREGDIVEATLRGTIHLRPNGYVDLDERVLRYKKGDLAGWTKDFVLTVIARGPKPIYVNHPRTTPLTGDIARDADDDESTDIWLRDRVSWWNPRLGTARDTSAMPEHLRLLIDGGTGQIVP